MLRQLTKSQIIEKFAGQDAVSAYVRLTIQSKTPKRIRSEVMPLYLEWGQRSPAAHQPSQVYLRAIAPLDLNWPEGDEQAIAEGGDIVVGNALLQIFAEDGQGQPLDEPEKAGDLFVLRVGELYSPNRTVWPQMGEYNLRDNTHELRLFFNRLTSQDVAAIREGPARFGLAVYQDILFLLYEFGRVCPWSDAPYSFHMVPKPDRTLPPDPASLAPSQGVALHIILVHAETGRIAALRVIGLGHDFSTHLLAAIHQQATRPFSQTVYDRQLMEAYQRYPTTQDLLQTALARYDVIARSA